MGNTETKYTALENKSNDLYIVKNESINRFMVVNHLKIINHELVITTEAGSTVIVSLYHPDIEIFKEMKKGHRYRINCTKDNNVYEVNYLLTD